MDKPAQLQINKRECFRGERDKRHGKDIVRIQRWKPDAAGVLRPVGVRLEFAERHIDGFISLLRTLSNTDNRE